MTTYFIPDFTAFTPNVEAWLSDAEVFTPNVSS